MEGLRGGSRIVGDEEREERHTSLTCRFSMHMYN
jgi:hypothetical protein